MHPHSNDHLAPRCAFSGEVEEPPIRVLIVCAVLVVCQALVTLLSAVDEIEVLGFAQGVDDLVDQIVGASADCVVVDVACPGALDLVRVLTNQLSFSGVVGLGLSESQHDIVSWAEAGLLGYIAPDDSLDQAIGTIRAVARGEARFSARTTARLLARMRELANNEAPERGSPYLTARELQVLQLIHQGLSNREIGDRLSIEVATVKTHVHSILSKLHLARRGQVSAWLGQPALTPMVDPRPVVISGSRDGSKSVA